MKLLKVFEYSKNLLKYYPKKYVKLKKKLKPILRNFTIEKEINCKNIEFRMLGYFIPPHYGIGKDYGDNGCHEPILTETIAEKLINSEDKVFWDIGSSIGYYSLLASSISGSKVHSFEGGDNSLIKINNEKYAQGRININAKYVGEKKGMLSLDKYYKNKGCPDVVKIDVDGNEKEVLLSMKRCVTKCDPDMFIEIHAKEKMYGDFISFLPTYFDDSYEFKVCYEHRSLGAKWREIDKISDLPSKVSEIGEIKDYMLYAHRGS